MIEAAFGCVQAALLPEGPLQSRPPYAGPNEWELTLARSNQSVWRRQDQYGQPWLQSFNTNSQSAEKVAILMQPHAPGTADSAGSDSRAAGPGLIASGACTLLQ